MKSTSQASSPSMTPAGGGGACIHGRTCPQQVFEGEEWISPDESCKRVEEGEWQPRNNSISWGGENREGSGGSTNIGWFREDPVYEFGVLFMINPTKERQLTPSSKRRSV